MKDTDNAPLQIQREQGVDQRLQVMFFLSAALLIAAGLFAIFCVKDKSRAS